jgi:hypothetical protein
VEKELAAKEELAAKSKETLDSVDAEAAAWGDMVTNSATAVVTQELQAAESNQQPAAEVRVPVGGLSAHPTCSSICLGCVWQIAELC